jgi:tRNA dimethylallyltransferase
MINPSGAEKSLIDETKDLLKRGYDKSLKSMQSIGYKQALDYLDDLLDERELEDVMNRETKRLARKQITWFGADKAIQWYHPKNDFQPIIESIKKYLKL